MRFINARSKVEALQVLADYGPDATILAGGTDVMIQIGKGEITPRLVLNVERIPELRYQQAGPSVELGALVTQRELAESETVRRSIPALSAAARLCGGWQTQSVGTLGGNICNASPAADLAPPLLAHGAEVLLCSAASGERWIGLEDFILGRRKIARRPDELVVGFRHSPMTRHAADCFEKVGRRGAMEISISSVAVRLVLDEERREVSDINIAVGAAGPKPFRARAAEDLLKGQVLTDNLVSAAASAVLDHASPIDDVRGSRAYRMAVIPRVVARCIRRCLEQINAR